MCTPAIAEGLSKSTSASLHCSHESTRTALGIRNPYFRQIEMGVAYGHQARYGTEGTCEQPSRNRGRHTHIRDALLEELGREHLYQPASSTMQRHQVTATNLVLHAKFHQGRWITACSSVPDTEARDPFLVLFVCYNCDFVSFLL